MHRNHAFRLLLGIAACLCLGGLVGLAEPTAARPAAIADAPAVAPARPAIPPVTPCPPTALGATTSCAAPAAYSYSFDFYQGCGNTTSATTVVEFQVALDGTGPWVTQDQQSFFQIYQPGTSTVQGSWTESNIPPQYRWYRFRITAQVASGSYVHNQTPAALLCTTPPASPTPTPPPCVPGWSLVNSPAFGELLGAAAVSANDIWAVGHYADDYDYQPVIEHWNGGAWRIVPDVHGDGPHNELYAVAARAANDVWAGGYYWNNRDHALPLIEHWDGSHWSRVALPAIPADNIISGIAAVAANDVWAVGLYSLGGAVLLHWDGAAWSLVPGPGGLTNPTLFGIAAVASNDVWAVGYDTGQTLTLHWNGTTWTRVPSPTPGSIAVNLLGVAARATNDVWAVGSYTTGTEWDTLILHWDGTSWTIVPSPNASSYANELDGVAVGGPNDAWAVGSYNTGPSARFALAMHWDGSQWSLVPPISPPSSFNRLNAVVLPAGAVWAVGTGDPGSLIERYDATCSAATPTAPPATPTAPPTLPATLPPSATPTATRPPATPTLPPSGTPPASPTPTVCAIQFTDVGLNNPFYSFIRCLACRGIISGYGDGTFRPYNDITRGQTSKIVSNAAGFTDAIASTQQSFADVPGSSPFWLWIERLARRGTISGYACGGPGEPCDPQNRPYFRANADVTRGQLAKIVSESAGFQDAVPTTQQTFADVPNTNTFWLWIERLAGRGVISGYACGSPGEPCDPQQRPYFRWGNATTRGQMAKIAAQTFYPNCVTPARR